LPFFRNMNVVFMYNNNQPGEEGIGNISNASQKKRGRKKKKIK